VITAAFFISRKGKQGAKAQRQGFLLRLMNFATLREKLAE
jgi:hypothetical protein